MRRSKLAEQAIADRIKRDAERTPLERAELAQKLEERARWLQSLNPRLNPTLASSGQEWPH